MNLLWLSLIGTLVPVASAGTTLEDYCVILMSPAACVGGGPGPAFVLIVANRVISFISGFIGAVAIAAFIWGCVKIVTSGGNDEGRSQGLDIIKTALIGVFLALMGNAILIFTEDFILTTLP